MISLHQKLNQLSLTTMSHQLDQTLADAAAQNLSFTQTLESLADLELESRNSRPSSAASVVAAPSAAFDRQLPLQAPQEPHGD